MTGGLILAGFHEVVCNEATLAAMERIRQNTPDRPLIRISSTFFYHLSPDELIEPLPELESRRQEVLKVSADGEDAADGGKTSKSSALQTQEYPRMYVGELVERELQHISLMA